MADQRPIFTPPTPQEFEGPFSAALAGPPQTIEPIKPVAPGGRISPLAAASALASKFFEGAAQGKARAWQTQQNNRISQITQLGAKADTLFKTDELTPEGQAYVRQEIARAMGVNLSGEIDGMSSGPGGKGKGKGKGKDGEQGVGHHILNAAKSVLEGMTGGKMPEGAKGLNESPDAVIGRIYQTIQKDPGKFYRSAQWEAGVQELDKARKALGPDATQQQAMYAMGPTLTRMQQAYPDRAKGLVDAYLRPYQAAPPPGSREWQVIEANKRLQAAQPGAQTQQPGPPGSQQGVMGPQGAPPETGQGQAAVGPPGVAQETELFRQRLNAYKSLGNSTELTPEDIEVTDDGGKTRQVRAKYVDTPEYTGYIDASTNEKIKGNVGGIHADRMQHLQVAVPGDPKYKHDVMVEYDPFGKGEDKFRTIKDFGRVPETQITAGQEASLKERDKIDAENRTHQKELEKAKDRANYLNTLHRIEQTYSRELTQITLQTRRSEDSARKLPTQHERDAAAVQAQQQGDASAAKIRADRDEQIRSMKNRYPEFNEDGDSGEGASPPGAKLSPNVAPITPDRIKKFIH